MHNINPWFFDFFLILPHDFSFCNIFAPHAKDTKLLLFIIICDIMYAYSADVLSAVFFIALHYFVRGFFVITKRRNYAKSIIHGKWRNDRIHF